MASDTCDRISHLRRRELQLRKTHQILAKACAKLNERLRSLRCQICECEKERLKIEEAVFVEKGLIKTKKAPTADELMKAADSMSKEDMAELLAMLESELSRPAEVQPEISFEELEAVEEEL